MVGLMYVKLFDLVWYFSFRLVVGKLTPCLEILREAPKDIVLIVG